MLITADLGAPESREFVQGLGADLGIVYGTQGAAPELFALPREGSLLLRKGRVLDCGRTEPPGREELLRGEQRIHLGVHRFATRPEDGATLVAAAIPIDAYDTLTSLTLKTNLVGDGLLVRGAADCGRGEARERPLARPIEAVAEPSPADCSESPIAPPRSPYKAPRGRPTWNLLLRTLLFSPWVVLRNWIRRWRGSAPVIILFHHVVTDRPHHLGIPTEHFLKHVEFLKRHYRVASLSEATEAIKAKRVKAPTVVLTFDDGYQENYVNLRAVAAEASITPTLFVCTAHISQQVEFEHDRKRQQHGFPPLTWEQVCYLSRNGFEIGSHTRSHFDCGSTEPAALQREIVGSKTDLEQRLGPPVKFFSFPWGQPANMSPAAMQLAKQTYPHVFSAYGGVNLPARNGAAWHLLRCNHFNDLWELELELQSVLEL